MHGCKALFFSLPSSSLHGFYVIIADRIFIYTPKNRLLIEPRILFVSSTIMFCSSMQSIYNTHTNTTTTTTTTKHTETARWASLHCPFLKQEICCVCLLLTQQATDINFKGMLREQACPWLNDLPSFCYSCSFPPFLLLPPSCSLLFILNYKDPETSIHTHRRRHTPTHLSIYLLRHPAPPPTPSFSRKKKAPLSPSFLYTTSNRVWGRVCSCYVQKEG